MKIKVGHGYDVHRLVEDRKLILGGVEIPYEKGLLGHSDADVLTHAVMDAVLGALGQRDIGYHFPDTDSAYRGANSLQLAKKIANFLTEEGYSLSNIDATVIAQRPKLAPYLPEMKENLAKVFGINPADVNIKATTEEKLGFTGSGEGIAAHGVVLLVKL